MKRFSIHIFLRKVCIEYRTILFKIIYFFIPFHSILFISAVGISVPSILCILKFLLIQIYLRSGTLIEKGCPTKPYATMPKGILGNGDSWSLIEALGVSTT